MKLINKVSEINPDKIVSNLRVIRNHLAEGTEVIGVVKANAYGHGLAHISKLLISNDIKMLAVNDMCEGELLRHSGIQEDILILNNTPLSLSKKIITLGLTQSISDRNGLISISKTAKSLKKIVKVHLNINTGLNRAGMNPTIQTVSDIITVSKNPWIHIEGIYTHIANNDHYFFTKTQLKKFNTFVSVLKDRSITFPKRHVYSSGGIFNFRQTQDNAVRPGAALYGLQSGSFYNKNLKPALSVYTFVRHLSKVGSNQFIGYDHKFITSRVSVIATLPIGFGDGYPRSLSNNGVVLINGHRAPVVGNICLNNFMVDVTDIPNVKIGDKAVLLGEQGKESIYAEEIANKCGTINTEIVHNLATNSKLIYKQQSINEPILTEIN